MINDLGLDPNEWDGLPTMLFRSVMLCDADIRALLFGNIVLSGGSTMFVGMQERMTQELKSRVPAKMEVKVEVGEHGQKIMKQQ